MSKVGWAIAVCICTMLIGILLMQSTAETQKVSTDCVLETKKYGKRSVSTWDCD